MMQRIAGTKRGGNRPALPLTPIQAILGNGGTIASRLSGYKERTQQMALAAFVQDCLDVKAHGIGEAPVGTGKSLAYLIPAILSGQKTIVSVPTIALQEQLIQKDLPFLSQSGVMPKPFRFALLKGRRNYACNLKADRFLMEPSFERPEDAVALPAFSEWYRQTRDGDLGTLPLVLPMAVRNEVTADSDECLGESCSQFASCYGEQAKARAKSADVIVTNYALLMLSMQISSETGGMVSLLPEDAGILVLDESHQIASKARDAFTSDVTLNRWTRLEKRIRRLIERGASTPEQADTWGIRVNVVDDAVVDMFTGYQTLLEGTEDAVRLGDESEYMLTVLGALWRLNITMTEDAPGSLDDDDRALWKKTTGSLESLIVDLWLIACPREDLAWVRFAALDNGKVKLTAAPVDVAPFLRERLWSGNVAKVVISTSGTLSEGGTLDYFREQVGLDTAREIIVGTPFDYVRDTRLYIPDTDRLDPSLARKQPKDWQQYLDDLSDECTRLVNLSRGRAFLLFTSRRVMDAVYYQMIAKQAEPGRLPWPLMRQGDASQSEMVRAFKETPSVLFGLKSYWEGVDISGEALSLVVIVAMPFTPPTDPIFSARCEAVDRKYGRMASFRKISIPEATIALKQAFGRGKRTETDRAIVAILDGRLRATGGKSYRNGVIGSLPPSPLTSDIADVQRFFEE